MLLSRVLSPHSRVYRDDGSPRYRSRHSPFELRARFRHTARTLAVIVVLICIIVPILYYSTYHSSQHASSLRREAVGAREKLHGFLQGHGIWPKKTETLGEAESFGFNHLAQILTTLPSAPKYQLLVVAKVGNEASYILEWIEFHRLQGVEKFVLFLDDTPYMQNRQLSTLRLLSDYYAQLGLPDLIDLRSSAELVQDQLADLLLYDDEFPPIERTRETTANPGTETRLQTDSLEEVSGERANQSVSSNLPDRSQLTNFHRLGQQTLLKHAFVEYRLLTEWIVHIDIDEFLYSSTHDSLSAYLNSLYGRGDEHSGGNGPGAVKQKLGDQEIGLMYQNGNLTGIYTHARNFGLGDSYWFSPSAELHRNPATGNISLFFTPLVPALTSATPESRLHDLVQNATSYVGNGGFHSAADRTGAADGDPPGPAPPLPLFAAMADFYSQQSAHLGAQDQRLLSYPFQLERQTHRAPSIRDENTLELLDKLIALWPICQAVKDEIAAKPKIYQPILKDRTRLRNVLGRLNLPDWCTPGHMPPGLTSMGKSMIWTGLRYNPPKHFSIGDHERQWLATPRRNETTSRRVSRGPELSHKKNPRLCMVPWVHGCAHFTSAPMMMSSELSLDHHMIRSLESRTVGDAAWRSPNGWGKFLSHGAASFALLEYTGMIHSPEARDRFLAPLREQFYALHNPISAEERLRVDHGRLNRQVIVEQCEDLRSCLVS